MNVQLRRIAALLAVAILIASVPFTALAAPSATAQTTTVAPAASVTSANLTCVTFPSASVGYAAGSAGTIVKTTDGGSSWAVVRSGDGLAFTGIAFWDTVSGIAVTSDRQVWGTDNGGATWTQRNPDMTDHGAGPVSVQVHGVAALPGDASRATVVAGDPDPLVFDPQGAQTWETYDNGAWWRQAYEYKPSADPEEPLYQYGIGDYFGIDFVDGATGWVVGVDYGPDGSIVPTSAVARTTDGGVFWTPQTLGVATTLKAVSFASTLVGVTTSANGRVFYTSNGGTSWTEGTSGVFVSLNGVGMISASTGWAVGAGGTLIKTTNGGATWASAVSPTTENLAAVTFVGSAGWAVGNNGMIIRTTDGITWEIPSGVDTTGPTMTSLASSTHPSSSAWYSNNDPAFSWSASDPSGVAGYSYVLDQSLTTTPDTTSEGAATTASFTDKADGTWYMHVRAIDTLGNWGAASHLPVKIDTTAPSVVSLASSTHTVATSWYANNDPAFSWSPSDASSGVVGYSWTIDQSASTTPDTVSEGAGTTASFTDKADGVWYFHVRALDAAGNWGTAVHREVRIDTTGPTMTSLASSTHPSPTTWYANNDPAFSWSASDVNTTVTGYSWTIDQSASTLPDTVSEGTGTTTSFTDKADGTWYFHVRALDAAGNWGAASHLEVRIDTTGPTMSSLASSTHPSPATWYSNNDPAFSWSANDVNSTVAGYSYEIDQIASTLPDTVSEPAGATTSFTDKADGVWYFHARAVDTLGNWGAVSHLPVKIDTTKPTTTDNAAGPYAVDTAITLTPEDSSSGVAATYYVLDGVPGTGTSVSVTAEGNHTLEYASVDNAGNRETTQTATFLLDKSGPSITPLTSSTHASPTTWYVNNDPAFSWGATDAYSTVDGYSYEIDQIATTVPDTVSEGASASASFVDKADGTWYFHVRSRDSLGNWGAASHLAIKIDTAPPVTTDDHDAVYTAPATITLTPLDALSGVTATYYVLDGTPGTGTTVNTSISGDHTLEYASVDAAGNRETTVSVDFTVDLTAPSIVSLASSTHPSSTTWYSNNDPAFSWSASDPGSVTGYSYVLDQAASTIPDGTSEGTDATTSFADKGDGVWYFHIRAGNAYGVWGSTGHFAVKIDTTKPTTTDDAAGPYAVDTTITLTSGDSSSGVAATYYVLDGVPGTGTSVSVTAEGNHTLEYASVDNAGNRETTQTATFLLDKSGPTITSLTSSTHASPTTWYANNDPAFSWGATDAYSTVDGYSYQIDQIASTTPDTVSEGASAAASFVDKADGTWYFHVRSRDSLGNWGSASHFQVLVDTTKPLTSATPAVVPGSGTVTLEAFDALSGVAGISWTVVGGSSGSGASPQVVALSSAGTYTVQYRATDAASNQESLKSLQVTVPAIVPDELIITPIAGANRIDTAIIASQKAFPAGATTVVIATGFNWPDALGGAALAGALDAPILLTDPSTLSPAVSAEITRLGASKAVILGGTGAVGTGVESALKSRLGTANVTRVAGTNRYETARKIAEATAAKLGAAYDGKAFVATGGNFPDALGASPLAAANGWPIYLVDPRGADSALVASMQSVGVTDAIMLGGIGAVSAKIESDLKTLAGCRTSRLEGDDRYDTARVVATYGVTDAGLSWNKVAIATGLNFPDALAGGVLQGKTGSVMLLTPGTALYPGVSSTLTANRSAILEVRFLGGVGAINQSVRDAVVAALQ